MAAIEKQRPLTGWVVEGWSLKTSALVVALVLGLVAVLLSAIALSQPWETVIDVGGPLDTPYLRGFYGHEHNSTERFRWSGQEAEIVLPGSGRLASLELRLLSNAKDKRIQVDTGFGAVTVPLRNGWQRVWLLPPPDKVSGDVQVRITAPVQTVGADPRKLGIVLDQIELDSNGGVPPPGQALLIGLSVVLLTLLTSWSTRRPWVGALAGTTLLFAMLTVLMHNHGESRLLLTDYTGRLALVLGLGGVLAVGTKQILTWLRAQGIIVGGLALPRSLGAVVLLAFLLRFGGMAYPLTTTTDLRFSLARASMVRDGKFLSLFLPNTSLTPSQWEIAGPIPRSPLYYVVTAPFTYLPGDDPTLAITAFSSMVDAFAVLLVALLVLGAGGSDRAAVLAALLAATVPLGLMLAVSWGVFPTLFAQFLMLLAMVVWVYIYPKLHQLRMQVLFAGALTLAYISYPTALMFLGVTWLFLVVLLALRRDSAAGPTLRAGIIAAVAALVLFYGWHIPVLLTRTIPEMLHNRNNPTDSSDTITTLEVLRAITNPLIGQYGLLIIVLAGSGAVLLLTKTRSTKLIGTRTLILCWWITYLPLALANGYVVTLILKHILYMLPALAFLNGLLLGRMAQRRWGRVVAIAIVLLVCWQGLASELRAIIP